MHLVRTYNSKLAEGEGTPGPFGYGWTGSYSARIFRASTGEVTVYQDNGSTVTFEEATRGQLTPTQPWIHATLKTVSGQYVYTLPNQTKLTFTSGGYLEQETDRNGNTTTIAYEESEEEGGGVSRPDFRSRSFSAFDVEEPPRIATVTDASGRQLTFSYTEDGLVNAVSDPEGHAVKYEYEEGNLVKTTLAGEAGHHNEYGYDELHRMTSIADGRKETTEIAYDEEGRAISEVDPADGELKLEYASTEGGSLSTTITEPSGAVIQETFNSDGLLVQAIHGFGTADAVTVAFVYDGDCQLTGVADGNGHTTKYTYDSSGNRTSQTDPDGDKSEWEYDEKRDVISTTTPNGEQTTIERDANGNALEVSRPAPGGTQTTEYAYNGDGELTSMTDPLERVWKYEYDANGNRIAEIDPEDNKRTFGYNSDSQEIATTSPRGNVSGADPTRYTTIIERDAQGRVSRVIEPLE